MGENLVDEYFPCFHQICDYGVGRNIISQRKGRLDGYTHTQSLVGHLGSKGGHVNASQ